MKACIPAYELESEGVVTPKAMKAVRFNGSVPATILITFHYNSEIVKDLAGEYYENKSEWYRGDFAPFTLSGADKGCYILPGTGAPALVYDLENLRVCGAKRFVLFGKAGFLKKTSADLVVPEISYIDEGTSDHYISGTEGVEPDRLLSCKVRDILKDAGFAVSAEPVWTTDAIYRETPGRIEYFRAKGCLCVDMETSALFSFCRRYCLEGASVLYMSDFFSEEGWSYQGEDFNGKRLSANKALKALMEGI